MTSNCLAYHNIEVMKHCVFQLTGAFVTQLKKVVHNSPSISPSSLPSFFLPALSSPSSLPLFLPPFTAPSSSPSCFSTPCSFSLPSVELSNQSYSLGRNTSCRYCTWLHPWSGSGPYPECDAPGARDWPSEASLPSNSSGHRQQLIFLKWHFKVWKSEMIKIFFLITSTC